MSNGSQIGGAVGAVVGGIIGFYTGNWQAVQWGYAIGSAVGGYVDPTKVQGPRLEDASTQTSTVGGVIPFGYGVFTCAGNIIWADQLIEHKKSERVGKGGSQKNITYTYTRSYAIGVCEGQIYNYLWIKKNGKLVYSADPAGLGAAMGWTGKQISDLVAASGKFLQESTLYYGTDSQMPDSTIVAVEGVGNVSPFRDLAYIVKENEDLTDMQGAVSQYEFCIRATPPEAYLTSLLYPTYTIDRATVSAIPTGGTMKLLYKEATVESDSVALAAVPTGGKLKSVYLEARVEGDSAVLAAIPTGGLLLNATKNARAETDAATIGAVPTGGKLKAVPQAKAQTDAATVGAVPTGGSLTAV